MEVEIIKWGAYALVGLMGWLLRVLWTAQEQMRKDFNELEKELPVHYVRVNDFKEAIRDVKDGFKEAINPVLNKLDRMEQRMEDQSKENEKIYQRKHDQ